MWVLGPLPSTESEVLERKAGQPRSPWLPAGIRLPEVLCPRDRKCPAPGPEVLCPRDCLPEVFCSPSLAAICAFVHLDTRSAWPAPAGRKFNNFTFAHMTEPWGTALHICVFSHTLWFLSVKSETNTFYILIHILKLPSRKATLIPIFKQQCMRQQVP